MSIMDRDGSASTTNAPLFPHSLPTPSLSRRVGELVAAILLLALAAAAIAGVVALWMVVL